MSLHLFLSHADTHAPVVADGLSGASADAIPKPKATNPSHLADRGGLADALPDQRWGLIVPKGEAGKRLRALVERLERRRAEDQGAEVVVYEVDPDMGPEEANLWISRDYRDKVQRDEAALPRYLLLLGGPDQISWDFQQMLATDGFVGRLAFTDERGGIDAQAYEAYVDKVLRWEEGSPVDAAGATFYTVRDGSGAIKDGYRFLMKPSAEAIRELHRKGNLLTSDVLEIGGGDKPSSIDGLLDAAHSFLGDCG